MVLSKLTFLSLFIHKDWYHNEIFLCGVYVSVTMTCMTIAGSTSCEVGLDVLASFLLHQDLEP